MTPEKYAMPTKQELRKVTIEEYIEANGGLLSFLEGLATFAKENGMDWSHPLGAMYTEAEWRARMFQRIGL